MVFPEPTLSFFLSLSVSLSFGSLMSFCAYLSKLLTLDQSCISIVTGQFMSYTNVSLDNMYKNANSGKGHAV